MSRQPKIRMQACFHCAAPIGIYADDRHDEFDTCGKPACKREAGAEAYERMQEERDWHCE